MMTTQARIDRWLGELLATAADGDGVNVVLVHAAVDQSQRTVKSWRLADALEDVAALVTEIDEGAQEDAEGLGGRQRYVLRAQLKGREIGSLTLRYEYRGEDGGPAVDSEPATAAGTIAVLQRHAEGAMRLMVQSFSGVIESYKEQVSAQKALIAEFQRQAAETFRLQEELASRKVEQTLVLEERRKVLELEAAKEVSELKMTEAMKMKGFEALLKYAPMLLHYATKGEVGTAPEEVLEGERQAEEEGRLASLTDDKLEELRNVLAPAAFAALVERVRAARGKREGRRGGAERAQPAEDDRAIASAAERLYKALGARMAQIQGLAVAFMARTTYEELGDVDRQVLEEVAAAPSAEPRALWAALLSREPQALLPIVGSLTTGTEWARLGAEQKMHLMAVVGRAHDLADSEGSS